MRTRWAERPPPNQLTEADTATALSGTRNATRLMITERFLNGWQRSFRDVPLLGFALRELLPDRWFRIHNHPESKRYPSIEEEYAELLMRQNAVLTTILGDRESYMVVTNHTPDELSRLVSELGSVFHPLVTIPVGQLRVSDFDEEAVWTLNLANVEWRAGVADLLLRQVAGGETVNSLFINSEVNAVAIPYDGGMDVIASSSSMRDALRERFSDWLSPHPSGL